MKGNKWKVLFLGLLGLIILFAIILFIMVSIPAKDDPYESVQLNETDYAPFHISTNKNDLNLVINHYLEEEILDGGLDYEVRLDDEVNLYGTLPVFSQQLRLRMSFEPSVLPNGDVVLEQKDLSIGQMDLPISFLLKLINNHYKTPDWVVIQPNEEKIYVALTEMDLKSDIKVNVNDFNLEEDEIDFTLLVPVK
ncbi:MULTISPECIES: YpmS family protein [Cytobacillus]|uniref:YpmS family protein n=1 Tax=Cytobacillus stercorigallinarum TaxID=2762240 RepID=A0ABR8QKY9_9BACI|nr:YpmS family protein [Cytobacillus stercorigallinarum]MBD7936183.1 YpmS family protein [Cytobacillus stercorigallinarum]